MDDQKSLGGVMVAAKRSFRIVAISGKGKASDTIFHGVTPSRVAMKAFNKYCRDNRGNATCSRTLTLENVTKGGDHKQYVYKATRKLRATPKKYVRGGVDRLDRYETVIRRA